MTESQKITTAIVALVILVSAGWAYTIHERSVGARDARIAVLEATNAKLVGQIGADSVTFAKRDTVKLFRNIGRIDSVITTLLRADTISLHDTLHVHHTDTVRVERQVLVTIDSTIRACRVTVSDCAQLANDRAARIRVLDSLVANLKQTSPGFFARWGQRLAWGAAGGLAGYAIKR